MSTKKETTNTVVLSGANLRKENPYVLSILKQKIETDANEKVRECIKHSNTPLGKSLVEIMEEGANEFKKQTGRNMTYSEMREMYG